MKEGEASVKFENSGTPSQAAHCYSPFGAHPLPLLGLVQDRFLQPAGPSSQRLVKPLPSSRQAEQSPSLGRAPVFPLRTQAAGEKSGSGWNWSSRTAVSLVGRASQQALAGGHVGSVVSP